MHPWIHSIAAWPFCDLPLTAGRFVISCDSHDFTPKSANTGLRPSVAGFLKRSASKMKVFAFKDYF